MNKYKEKLLTEVQEGKRGSVYPALRKLGLRPGISTNRWFQLPNHVENCLNPTQSAELIADHFSAISQEFQPLCIDQLPPNIICYLNDPTSIPPNLSTTEVFKRIIKSKKPNSKVPGDLEPRLVKAFPNLLSFPVTQIFNEIIQSATYPRCWKVEHQVPIPKTENPLSEDHLRNIAKTPYFSKVFESFVADWLLVHIKPFLDPNQCGMKGLSTTHYLIKFLHFVHSSLDKKKPQAVLAAYVDLSKAFNRTDHGLVIQDLYDMHTPAWLLRLICSYLSDRSMILSYDGAVSTQRPLPGGCPQGAFLGGIIFMIKFNGALLRPPIPRPVNFEHQAVKFVDDGSIATSIDMKATLTLDSTNRPRPLNFNERTGHTLPPHLNPLQYFISDLENFAVANKMSINGPKTNVMLFNCARKWAFPPEVFFSNGSMLQVVEKVKLVGIMITNDLKWEENTKYLCTKARQKLWLLRRMKGLELSDLQMLDVYSKEIRSILEMCVPVWHPGLTRKQSRNIESIQKLAFRIILSHRYISYNNALSVFGVKTLEERRVELCKNFALKNSKSEFSFFEIKEKTVNTRSSAVKVQEYKCNTARFEKTSLPYLCKLLNQK